MEVCILLDAAALGHREYKKLYASISSALEAAE
jgi:hypothetical protein